MRRKTLALRSLCVLALAAAAISCSSDTTGPARDLGATVTYTRSGMVPRVTVVEVRSNGQVVARLVDVNTGEDIDKGRDVLTATEFDRLSALIASEPSFDACYCDDGGVSDGPTETVVISGALNLEVAISGVGGNALPEDLADLVTLLSAIRARAFDADTGSSR